MNIGKNLWTALLLVLLPSVALAQQQCSFLRDVSLGSLPNDMTLRQYVNGDTVTFEVVYAGLGWIGVGYSSTGTMLGSKAVIGLPDAGTVGLYNLGGYTTDAVTLTDEALTDASIEQTDTETILRFTRSTIQDGVPVFAAGETSKLIYAVGSDNNLAYHAARSSADVVFDDCEPIQAEPVCDFNSDISLGNGDITLRQYVNGEEATFEVVYAGLGWVGVGYSSNSKMVPNLAVIGLPDEGTVGLYNLGGYTTNLVTLTDEALTDASIEQTDTETILRFTRSTIQDGTPVFTAGETSTVIYAVGSGNTLAYHGATRGASEVLFEGCAAAGGDAPQPPATDAAPPVPAPVPATASPTAAPLAADGGPIELSDDVTVSLSADTEAGTLDVEMVYEGQGWVAFGVSRDGLMIGSECVIGLPDEPVGATNPAKYALSARANSGVLPLAEAQQTLLNANVVQNETHTVLTYTRLLEELDELPISAIDPNNFVFATGPSNSLGFHNQRASVQLTIGSNEVQEIGLSTRKLWVAHGVMMAAAWGVLVPIAIGSSILRGMLPPGMWFTMHFYSNSLAIVCTIIGFGLAIKAINDETGGGSAAGHFDDPRHRRVGLVVFLMTMVQVGVAYFRPHPPSPPKKDNADDEDDAQNGGHHGSSEKSTHRFAWEIKHRLFAAALLGMAWYNVDSGIELFAGKFGEEDDITGAFWGILCGIAGVVAIGYLIGIFKKKDETSGGNGPISEEMA